MPGMTAIFARYRSLIGTALRDSIPDSAVTSDLFGMLRYHLGWVDRNMQSVQHRGGKHLRPVLCLLCCEAVGGSAHAALPAAVALELLHNFSLIHDDIEDRGSERHGRPTVWALWGEPLAVNAGDAMLILSELALLRGPEHGLSPSLTVTMLRLLNECCLRLTEGQHLDLTLEGKPEVTRDQYFQIITGKTAALLGCSAELGALSGGAPPELAQHYREFGRSLGLAFQIQDDVLGIWGIPENTGKAAAADVYGHKVTLPIIDTLERAPSTIAARIAAVYRNTSPSAEDVAEVIGYLTAAGARERAEAIAADYVATAMAALTAASPRPDLAADLRTFAQALVGRTS